MSAERWLPVVGYEGLYEVSSLGRVRSLDRVTEGKCRKRVAGVILSQAVTAGTGYLGVGLWRGGRQERWNVHRLVSEAFLGPRPEGMDTCHYDGDKSNNSASNLRYDTRGNNLLDSVRHKTHRWSTVTHCPAGHPYDDVNTRIVMKKGRPTRHCRACERQYPRRNRPVRRAA